MIKVLVHGSNGKMGTHVLECIAKNSELELFCGVDPKTTGCENYKYYDSFDKVEGKADVIIDFSFHTLVKGVLDYAVKTETPVLIATTALDDEDKKAVAKASQKVPVFLAANMSVGVALLADFAKQAAKMFPDADIEIVESHHNRKVDAPSGTAIMLANAVNQEFDDNKIYEYDRHSKRQKRSKNEIGIHSVRGGTIVGEHDVIFAGHDEVITVSHAAYSREVFAVGAVRAAKFLHNKEPGLYDMNSIMNFG